MKNILIFGASGLHGVGGSQGGWADRLKLALHKDMYGPNGRGEIAEVYELGIPGETLSEMLARFEAEVRARVRTADPDQTYIIFSCGANDAKAVDEIDNHLTSPEDFAANVHAFIHLAKDYSSNILGVGIVPVDESKTLPKESPFSGRMSYFSNQRLKQFEDALGNTCQAEGVQFVPLFESAGPDWVQTCSWQDGLHPNDKGQEWIFTQVDPHIRSMLELQ